MRELAVGKEGTMRYLLLTVGFIFIVFLWGGIPMGYIVVKLIKGTDVRQQGSGNIGATNVRRVLGIAWFFGVLLLDAAKGAVPMLGALLLYGAGGFERIIVATAIICGNLFSPWLGFRGGKGIGTGLGVLAILAPFPMLIVLVVFVILLFASNYVSIASIVAAIALPIVIFSVEFVKGSAHDIRLLAFASVLACAITAMHKANLSRLASGTEHKFFARDK
jgi:acyl phosphate:glycerol-3-phosphate acyltransferase